MQRFEENTNEILWEMDGNWIGLEQSERIHTNQQNEREN